MVKLGTKFKRMLAKAPKGVIRKQRAREKKEEAQALAGDRRITAFDELPARSLAHINVETASIATSTDDNNLRGVGGGQRFPLAVHTGHDRSRVGPTGGESSKKAQKRMRRLRKVQLAQQKNLQRNVELARASEQVFGRDATVALGNTVAAITKGMAKGVGWVLRDPYFYQRSELRNLHPITLTVSARVHRLSFVHPSIDLNTVQRKAESMKSGKKKKRGSSSPAIPGTADSATAAAALERWAEMIKQEQFRISRDGIVTDHYQRQHQEEQRLLKRERLRRRRSSSYSPRGGNYGHQTRRKKVRVKGVRRVIASRTSSMANSAAFRGGGSAVMGGAYSKRKPSGSKAYKAYNSSLNPSKSKSLKMTNKISLTSSSKSKAKKLSKYAPEDSIRNSKSKRNIDTSSGVAPFTSFYDSGDFSSSVLTTATVDGDHSNHSSGEREFEGENDEEEYWSDEDGEDAQKTGEVKSKNSSDQLSTTSSGYSSKINWGDILSYVTRDGLAFAGGVLQDWSVARIGRYLPEIACRVPHSAICFDLKNNRHKTKGTQPFVVESPHVLWGSGRDPLLLKVAQEGSPFLDSRPLDFKSDFDLLRTEQSESLLLTTSTLFVDYPPSTAAIPTFLEQQHENAQQAEEAARRAAAKLRTLNPVDAMAPHPRKKMSVIGEESVYEENEDANRGNVNDEGDVLQSPPWFSEGEGEARSHHSTSTDYRQANSNATTTGSMGDASVHIGDIDSIPISTSSMSSPIHLRKEGSSHTPHYEALQTQSSYDRRQQFLQQEQEQRGSVKRPASVSGSVASSTTATGRSTGTGAAADPQVATQSDGVLGVGEPPTNLFKSSPSKLKRRRTISAQEEMETIWSISKSGSTDDGLDSDNKTFVVRSESCPASRYPHDQILPTLSSDRSMSIEGAVAASRAGDDKSSSFQTATNEIQDESYNLSDEQLSHIQDSGVLCSESSASMPTTLEEARRRYPNLFVVESTPSGDVMSRSSFVSKSNSQAADSFKIETPLSNESGGSSMNSERSQSSSTKESISHHPTNNESSSGLSNNDRSTLPPIDRNHENYNHAMHHSASGAFPQDSSSNEESLSDWYKWRSDSCPPKIIGNKQTSESSSGASHLAPIQREHSLPASFSMKTSTSSAAAKRAMSVPVSYQDEDYFRFKDQNDTSQYINVVNDRMTSTDTVSPMPVSSSSVPPPTLVTDLSINARSMSLPVIHHEKEELGVPSKRAHAQPVRSESREASEKSNAEEVASERTEEKRNSVSSSPVSLASSATVDVRDKKKKKNSMKAVALAVGKFGRKQKKKPRQESLSSASDSNSKQNPVSSSQNSTASSSGKAIGTSYAIDEAACITNDKESVIEEILPLDARAQSKLRSQQRVDGTYKSMTSELTPSGNMLNSRPLRMAKSLPVGGASENTDAIHLTAEGSFRHKGLHKYDDSVIERNIERQGNVNTASAGSWSVNSSSSGTGNMYINKTPAPSTNRSEHFQKSSSSELAPSLSGNLYEIAREMDENLVSFSLDASVRNRSEPVAPSGDQRYTVHEDTEGGEFFGRSSSESEDGDMQSSYHIEQMQQRGDHISMSGSHVGQRSSNASDDVINMGSISIMEDDSSSSMSATASSHISSAASTSRRKKPHVAVPDTIFESSQTLDVDSSRARERSLVQDPSSSSVSKTDNEANSLAMSMVSENTNKEIGKESYINRDLQSRQHQNLRVESRPREADSSHQSSSLGIQQGSVGVANNKISNRKEGSHAPSSQDSERRVDHGLIETSSQTAPNRPRLSTFEVQVDDIPERNDVSYGHDNSSVKSKGSVRRSIASRLISPKKRSKSKTETSDPAPYVLVLDEIIQFRVVGFPSSKVLATFPISVASILAERPMHDRLRDPSIPSELTLTLVQEPKASEGRWGVEATVTFRCVVRDTRDEKKISSVGKGKRSGIEENKPPPGQLLIERSHSADLVNTVEARKLDIAAHEEGTALLPPRMSQSCRDLSKHFDGRGGAAEGGKKELMPENPDDLMRRQMFYDPQVTKLNQAKNTGAAENGIEWMMQNQNSESSLRTDWHTGGSFSVTPTSSGRLSPFQSPIMDDGLDIGESSKSLSLPVTPTTLDNSPGRDMHWAFDDRGKGPVLESSREQDLQQQRSSELGRTSEEDRGSRLTSLDDLDITIPPSNTSTLFQSLSGEERSRKAGSSASNEQESAGNEGVIEPPLQGNEIVLSGTTQPGSIVNNGAETEPGKASLSGPSSAPPRQRSRQVSFETDQMLPFRPRAFSELTKEEIIGQNGLLLEESIDEEDESVDSGSSASKEKDTKSPGFLSSFIGQDMATTVLGPGGDRKGHRRAHGSDVTANLHRSLIRNAALSDSSATLPENDEDEDSEPFGLVMNANVASDDNPHFAGLVKKSLRKSGMEQSFYQSTADTMVVSLSQSGEGTATSDVFRGFDTASEDGTDGENNLFLSPSDLGLRSFPSSEEEETAINREVFWSTTNDERENELQMELNETNHTNDNYNSAENANIGSGKDSGTTAMSNGVQSRRKPVDAVQSLFDNLRAYAQIYPGVFLVLFWLCVYYFFMK